MSKKEGLTPEQLIETLDRNKVLKGKPLAYSAPLHRKYEKQLTQISRQMTAQTTREIKKLFKQFAQDEAIALDASVASQSRILMNAISRKFEDFFNVKSRAFSKAMVEQADKQSQNVLRLSLKDLSGGLTIDVKKISPAQREIIKASITQNVSLIKSIKQKYFTQVEGAVARSIVGGGDINDLIKDLLKYEKMTLRRARFIALDQTKKVYVSLNAERSKAVGLDKFEWLHSGRGKEPRQEHIAMNGKIYSYSDPPVIDSKTGQRGLPGELPNCGCVARPILDFEEAK